MFITLEGIEGSGKTTQLENIRCFLQQRGYACVVTREPGGTPIGEKIRSILLHPDSKGLNPLAELLLYEADRAEHVHRTIRPALAAGKVVICDRFCDATVVYQGYGRGLDRDTIYHLHRIVLGQLAPDLTLLFDLAPEIGLARAWRQVDGGGRTGSETRFEQEALDFHNRIRAGYLEIARCEPDRFRIVDAAAEEVRVTAAVIDHLKQLLDVNP